jgi:membrane associated rhomboid family serine protease
LALKDYSPEKRKFIHSLIFPGLFLFVLWMIKMFEIVDDTYLGFLGVYPRKIEGLTGILFSPLLHANFKHLIDNSISFLIMAAGVFYFYNKVAYKVFFTIYFASGILVWLIARPSYHIGASGLIYGFAAFLFFSGIIRQNMNLLAISLLVTFLYGSMVWGIFPYRYDVSWESHLAGGAIGFILSFVYRRVGPPPTRKDWQDENEEEEDEEDEEDAVWKQQDNSEV